MEKINTRIINFPLKEEYFSQLDYKELKQAAQLIKNGELVAFPTETVYGLGGNGLDAKAAEKIYAAKGRPSDNPLILHFADLAMIKKYLGNIPLMAEKLLTLFAPGPLTVIVPKTSCIPYTVTGGLDTVAIRIPDNDITRNLITLADLPIAGPSANTSGKPSPTTASMVYSDLKGKLATILDAGPCKVGLESTILDCTGANPVILRPGAITKEMLEEIFPLVTLDAALDNPQAKPKAPGMKYKHYAPDAPLELLQGPDAALVDYIVNTAQTLAAQNQQLGLFLTKQLAAKLPPNLGANIIKQNMGDRDNLSTVANNIYSGLRYFNSTAVALILGEALPEKDLGLAIMNRLKKAAGGKIIKMEK